MPKHLLSWDDFRVILEEIGEEDNKDAILEGLNEKGREYGLKADISNRKLDSLDVVELVMRLEEKLGVRFGLGKDALKIEDEWVTDAANVGDLYDVICDKFDAGPEATPDAAAA